MTKKSKGLNPDLEDAVALLLRQVSKRLVMMNGVVDLLQQMMKKVKLCFV